MKQKLKLLILFSFLNMVIMKFESSNICEQENKKCTRFYDIYNKFEITCGRYECFGSFNHTCGEDNCAIDEKSCLYFQALNSNLIRKIISPASYKYKLRKHEKILQMIKSWPSPSYKWNPKDVCIRNSGCFLKHEFPFMNQLFSIKKRIKCFCEQKHSYQCIDSYCVANKQVCDALVLKLASISKQGFNKCNHLNKTIERKILF